MFSKNVSDMNELKNQIDNAAIWFQSRNVKHVLLYVQSRGRMSNYARRCITIVNQNGVLEDMSDASVFQSFSNTNFWGFWGIFSFCFAYINLIQEIIIFRKKVENIF